MRSVSAGPPFSPPVASNTTTPQRQWVSARIPVVFQWVVVMDNQKRGRSRCSGRESGHSAAIDHVMLGCGVPSTHRGMEGPRCFSCPQSIPNKSVMALFSNMHRTNCTNKQNLYRQHNKQSCNDIGRIGSNEFRKRWRERRRQFLALHWRHLSQFLI